MGKGLAGYFGVDKKSDTYSGVTGVYSLGSSETCISI